MVIGVRRYGGPRNTVMAEGACSVSEPSRERDCTYIYTLSLPTYVCNGAAKARLRMYRSLAYVILETGLIKDRAQDHPIIIWSRLTYAYG